MDCVSVFPKWATCQRKRLPPEGIVQPGSFFSAFNIVFVIVRLYRKQRDKYTVGVRGR